MGWSFSATGTGIIVSAIAFLVIGGIIYTNMQASGYSNPAPYGLPCQAANCAAFGQSNPTPIITCQNPAECQLSTPSFFNKNSPFTAIFQGNPVGFFSGIWNLIQGNGVGSQTQGQPFALWGRTAYFATCRNNNFLWPDIFNSSFSQTINLRGKSIECQQTFINGTIVPTDNSYNVMNSCNLCTENWNISWVGATASPQYFDYLDLNNTGLPSNMTVFTIDFNWNQASTLGSLGQVMNATFITATPTLYNDCSTGSNVYPKTEQECLNVLNFITTTGQQITNNQLYGFSLAMGMVGGFLLLLIGLGLGVGSGALTFSFSLNPNSQGTRLAQVLGLTLLWSIPLYSEFGSWFSALGGFGADALVTVIWFMVMFIGLIQQISAPAQSS